jgi:ABC-type Mn2+/Zn2+ transport system ATPase subunit
VTVLVATHDLNQAARCFDRVMLLNRRLVDIGVPQDVFRAETLRQAYGDHLQIVGTEGETLMMGGNGTCERGA